MELPRITLVTPSYQQGVFLEDCLRSVHEQGYPNLEHIVVDGGSTDGSVAILERWSDRLSAWSSFPDDGQSAAIDHGLRQATGTVFAWLNSDDMLLPGSLFEVGGTFASHHQVHTVTGARLRMELDGRRELIPADPASDPEAWAVAPRVNQSSTFMRTDRVRALGGVDERLHHVMDLELWWQMLFHFGAGGIKCLEGPLSVFRMHPASKTAAGMGAFVAETAWLLQGYCREVGAFELAEVLAIDGYRSDRPRPLGVGPTQRELIERMACGFLMKWHRHLHTRTDLARMKALQRVVKRGGLTMEDLGPQWHALQSDLGVPCWLAHRLRRKWRSWRA